MSEPIAYAAALAELERILDELEAGPADVDRLTERVARAAELIRVCRERIGAARLEVERIVAGLEADREPGTDEEPADDPGSDEPTADEPSADEAGDDGSGVG